MEMKIDNDVMRAASNFAVVCVMFMVDQDDICLAAAVEAMGENIIKGRSGEIDDLADVQRCVYCYFNKTWETEKERDAVWQIWADVQKGPRTPENDDIIQLSTLTDFIGMVLFLNYSMLSS